MSFKNKDIRQDDLKNCPKVINKLNNKIKEVFNFLEIRHLMTKILNDRRYG